MAAVALGAAGRRSATAAAGQRLEGTWFASFNTVPPVPTPAEYRFTFTDGGGLVVVYPSLRPQTDGTLRFVTDGVGEWVRTGERAFSFMYVIDLFEVRTEAPPTPRIETHTVWADITLNDQLDRWDGVWKRQNVDQTGAVVGGLDGQVTAVRMAITPMP
jgi:hypothetical protein